MEKLAAGLTILTLVYTALVFITLLMTGWFDGLNVPELLKPVRSLAQSHNQKKSGRSSAE